MPWESLCFIDTPITIRKGTGILSLGPMAGIYLLIEMGGHGGFCMLYAAKAFFPLGFTQPSAVQW